MCFWFIHSWTPWKTISSERFGVSYWEVIQERKCIVCGKLEVRRRCSNS